MMDNKDCSRRDFLRRLAVGALVAGGIGAAAGGNAKAQPMVWQIDPQKCVMCGNCATSCVLDQSAVRAVHSYAMCGRCGLCYGFFDPEHTERDTAAENQLCPAGAIIRTYLDDPYYEYTVDEEKCIGCGKCVAGCESFGNGSLYLQVRHDKCVNCNQCSIATVCQGKAFKRVPANKPYLLKKVEVTD